MSNDECRMTKWILDPESKGRGRLTRSRPFSFSERQHHERRTVDRVEAVGRGLDEAQRAIERPRVVHRRQRVEQHTAMAEAARFVDERDRNRASDAAALCGGS